ncbi:Pyroglutamylated RFamide peptide receptor [Habropoda laboriosa]|uniref:Pyroglutamylated RFamide peptide receptor n=1 Tax=Habropoda laboriosa TaxID=597456 RepID=A0A0L7RCP8_9HYME|nr:Pyroglutamylated RFamide peptide receptor [Habropoda laboriosa]
MSNETNATDDFLDYDINESFSHFDWAELGPVVVVYSLTFFLGLIGNVVIIGSTLCPRLRPLPATPTNVFLGGLATADLLLIIFCIPVKFHIPKFPYSQIPIFPYFCIPKFPYSQIPIFPYSQIPIFPNYHIPKFPYSQISIFQNSQIPTFPYSQIIIFSNYHIPKLSYSQIPIFPNVAKLFSYTWTMGLFLCKSVHYMQSVSAICSVVTLTAMSIERYYAIVHPMRAQYTCTISQARKIVIITWVASFLLGIPMIFTQAHKEVGMRVIAYWCVRDSEIGLLWRAHEVYMLVLVLVLPLTVMAFCYTAICWEIWRVMKRRYHMTSHRVLTPTNVDTESIPMTQRQSVRNSRRSHREDGQTEEESRTMKQVVKMLVAVVVLFAICWGPILVDNMLTAYGFLPRVKVGTYKHLNTAFQLMAYFNSCINPIVYGFMSKHFRESFLSAACGGWWICCPRKGYRAPVKRHPSLSQTRTTSVRYDVEHPKSMEAFLKKVTGKRGPYDLFTGPRDHTTVRGYFASKKLEDRGDWPKSLPSELNKLLHKSNYFKGRWTTCPRFPKVSGMRIMLKDLALCYKDPNQPGPGHYDPKSPRKPRNTKNYPFNMNVEFIRPVTLSEIRPGPGRYTIKDKRPIEGHGWTSVFKSKAPRTNFIVIPTYNAF